MKLRTKVIFALFLGTSLQSCANVDYYYKVELPPTCVSAGYEVKYVNGVKDDSQRRLIEPTGHDWGEEITVLSPTCQTDGLAVRQCKNCDSVQEKPIEKGEHNPTDKVYYFDSSYHWQKCICDTEVNKVEHSYDKERVIMTYYDSNHGNIKVNVVKCDYCDYTHTVMENEGNHSIDETVFYKDSNYHWNQCSCGAIVNKSSHSFDNGVITKQPTTEETGIKTYTCTLCGATKEESISKIFDGNSGLLSGYYANASYKSGKDLKNALRSIISVRTNSSYDDLKSTLQSSDEDPNNKNNMILFYAGVSIPKTSNMNIWNREHVWPKSLGVDSVKGNYGGKGPYSDPHHLRPADPTVNSTRGNYKTGICGSSKKEIMYNSTIHTGCYYGGGIFEPRDGVKGDMARIYLYMITCYVELDPERSTYYKQAFQSIEMLLDWNRLDPVDTMERNRNEVLYSTNKNRNPYIDHPEFADIAWGHLV